MRRAISIVILSLSLSACAETSEMYVPGPPPAPQQEVVVAAPPYPGAVWIGGYWGWEGGRHIWHRGTWERPRPGYVWQPHRYEQRGNRWAYVRGGWRRHQ